MLNAANVSLEEFKACLFVVYLNEQKVDSLSKAAVLADVFVLTHHIVFPSVHTNTLLLPFSTNSFCGSDAIVDSHVSTPAAVSSSSVFPACIVTGA